MTKEKENKFVELANELLGVPKKHLLNMLEIGIIDSTRVNMFLVLNLYPKYKDEMSKADAVRAIADDSDLSESYVRSVISNYPQYILQHKYGNCWERVKKTETAPDIETENVQVKTGEL